MDLTTAMDIVPTITGRVLYVFVLLYHALRWLVHFNVTATPSGEWLVRQLKVSVSVRLGTEVFDSRQRRHLRRGRHTLPEKHGHHRSPHLAGLALAERLRRAVHRHHPA